MFWRQGYEGTSLTDLTEAMGISRPSMYAAFGNKEQLFLKALDAYSNGPASYATRALQQPTAKAVAEYFLRGAVLATTMEHCPHGCLGVQGALASGQDARSVREALVKWRTDAFLHLQQRFEQAIKEGDLSGGPDAARLARFVMTVGFGIAVQAATGARREELDEIADDALVSLG